MPAPVPARCGSNPRDANNSWRTIPARGRRDTIQGRDQGFELCHLSQVSWPDPTQGTASCTSFRSFYARAFARSYPISVFASAVRISVFSSRRLGEFASALGTRRAVGTCLGRFGGVTRARIRSRKRELLSGQPGRSGPLAVAGSRVVLTCDAPVCETPYALSEPLTLLLATLSLRCCWPIATPPER